MTFSYDKKVAGEDRALKKFLTVHDLVISVPLAGTHFLDPSQQPKHAIRYRSHNKLYCGLSTSSKAEKSSLKQEMGAISNYSQGTTRQSIITLLSAPSNCSISYFYIGDFFIPKEYFLLCKEIIIDLFHNNNFSLLEKPITFTAQNIKEFIKKLTLEQKIPVAYFAPLFTTHKTITTRRSDETTTFDIIQRPNNIRHIVTQKENINNDFSHQTFYDSENTQSQKTLLALIKYLKETPSHKIETQEIITLFNTIRSKLLMLWNEDNNTITDIFKKEESINKNLPSPNRIFLIPTKYYLHRYIIKDPENPSKEITSNRNINTHLRKYTILFDSNNKTNKASGLDCEQRITKGKLHTLSPEAVALKTTKRGIQKLPIENINFNKGIILDGRKNKVYINGKQFSSKELPSQKAIIEIIGMCIKNYGKILYNTDLPRSSYSSNKNNLSGKILSPFIKTIASILDKKLIIVTKGGLHDYTIRLPKQHLPIILIDSLV